MSVIGRMDEQVDEILIKPLSKKQRGDEEAPAPPTPAADPPSESTDRDETSAPRDELPVWML